MSTRDLLHLGERKVIKHDSELFPQQLKGWRGHFLRRGNKNGGKSGLFHVRGFIENTAEVPTRQPSCAGDAGGSAEGIVQEGKGVVRLESRRHRGVRTPEGSAG